MPLTLHSPVPFTLENGATLPSITLTYSTFGKMAPDGSNVVWVCHPATEDCEIPLWWKNMVVPGALLDPERYFTVCCNVLGSPYGCTNPASADPATGKPYGAGFPLYSVRDTVKCCQLLASHLGIGHIPRLIGCSLGGFLALEWLLAEPERFGAAALVATSPRTSPWISALQMAQRMAIEASGETETGVGTARAIAMLSFRGPLAFNRTQEEFLDPQDAEFTRRVQTYLTFKGEEAEKVYHPMTYTRLTQNIDSHNVMRGRGPMDEVLKRLQLPVYVVNIDTDPLFPPREYDHWVPLLPRASRHTLQSIYGHDAFLLETAQLSPLLQQFFASQI